MNSLPLRLLPATLAALALSTAAIGQVQSNRICDLRWDGDIDWDDVAPSGEFGRMVAGDFQRDGGRDAFLRDGAKLIFFFDPAINDGIDHDAIASAVPVNDLTETQHASGAGSDLLVVGPSGLSRVSWDAGSQAFTVTSISSSGSWPGAVIVRAQDIDQNGVPDIVGVASNQRTVIVRMNGAANDTTFDLGPTNSAVHDLRFVRWDTAGTYRLCFLDSYGVEILTHAGVRVNRVARPTSTFQDAIAVFRKGYDGNNVLERVAWARKKANAAETQEVVELYRTSAGVQLVLSGITRASENRILQLASADIAAIVPDPEAPDQNDELLAMTATDYVPVLYRNLATATGQSSFGTGSGEWQLVDDTTLSKSAATVTGGGARPLPLFEDLTGDGAPDVLVPIQWGAASWAQVWRDNYPTMFPGGTVTRFVLPTPTGTDLNRIYPPNTPSPAPAATFGSFRLLCDMPGDGNATGVKVIVWKRNSCSLDDENAAYVLSGHFYFPFGSGTQPENLDLWMPIDFEVDLFGDMFTCQDTDFWMQLHLANKDGSTYTQVGANWVAALTTTNCGLGEGTVYLDDDDPDWRQHQCVRGTIGCDGDDCCLNGCGTGTPLDSSITRRRRLLPTSGTLPSAGPPTDMPPL